MTEQATEKQIKFAESLGIENPASFSKQALREMINNKLGKDDGIAKEPVKPGVPAVQEAKHDVVIQRTERPHSYEFGKATSRHKIYYAEVSDLKAMIADLKEAGFIEPEVSINLE